MKIVPTSKINDVFLVTPDIFSDFRGEYIETYNDRNWKFGEHDIKFVQDDVSVSTRHVLRGLHGDWKTWKLVQCLQGMFYLVIVDCRKEGANPSYGQCFGITLNDKSRQQVLIPPGCANGHLCMSETCMFHYKQSTYYEGADKQFTLRWDTKGVFWPIDNPILSERDLAGRYFTEIE